MNLTKGKLRRRNFIDRWYFCFMRHTRQEVTQNEEKPT